MPARPAWTNPRHPLLPFPVQLTWDQHISKKEETHIVKGSKDEFCALVGRSPRHHGDGDTKHSSGMQEDGKVINIF